MRLIKNFDYEELCILLPIMKRASKKYVEKELEKIEPAGVEVEKILTSLKEKISKMDESEIRILFDELPSESY